MRIAWCLIIGALPAMAQITAVSSKGVIDTDGMTWAQGTFEIKLIPAPMQPNLNAYTWNGGNLTGHTQFDGDLDSSASFTEFIPDNSFIAPKGSQWSFTICPKASAGCFTFTTTAGGAIEDMTLKINALAVGPRFAASVYSTFGYSTIEVSPAPPAGTVFYNSITQACAQWDGATWGACT